MSSSKVVLENLKNEMNFYFFFLFPYLFKHELYFSELIKNGKIIIFCSGKFRKFYINLKFYEILITRIRIHLKITDPDQGGQIYVYPDPNPQHWFNVNKVVWFLEYLKRFLCSLSVV